MISARYVDVRAWIHVAVVGIMTISCTQSAASVGLVRDGATGVLIQQYGGLNDQPPLGLVESIHLTNSSEMGQLVHELNSLPAYPSENMHCPNDDLSNFALVFAYGDGASTQVKAEALGCQGVYLDGSKQPVAWAAKSPELFDTLRRLL